MSNFISKDVFFYRKITPRKVLNWPLRTVGSTKHTPVLSFLRALAKPSWSAMDLTSVLVLVPRGKSVRLRISGEVVER